MIRIIPAIFAESEKEFLEKINKIKNLSAWAQIDVMDGKFVPKKSPNKPSLIKKFPRLNFEIHLMVREPEKYIAKWAAAGAKKIIFHIESQGDPEKLVKKIKKAGCGAGVAINPETDLEKIFPILEKVDVIMLMGNSPGKQGQKFQEKILKRAKQLRKLKPDIKLEVDAGVNEKTTPKIKKAGIETLVSGSYIFSHSNPAEAIKILKK